MLLQVGSGLVGIPLELHRSIVRLTTLRVSGRARAKPAAGPLHARVLRWARGCGDHLTPDRETPK